MCAEERSLRRLEAAAQTQQVVLDGSVGAVSVYLSVGVHPVREEEPAVLRDLHVEALVHNVERLLKLLKQAERRAWHGENDARAVSGRVVASTPFVRET